MIAPSMLLKSWAIPAASVPRASIFWVWVSCSISILLRRSDSRRLAISRMEATTSRRSPTVVVERVSSMGTVVPSACLPTVSKVEPFSLPTRAR